MLIPNFGEGKSLVYPAFFVFHDFLL